MSDAVEKTVDALLCGLGVAVRKESDPPIQGEPFISMADARRLLTEQLSNLKARDAEVARAALERAAAACGEIANLRNGRGNFFFDRGDQGSAICERHEAIGAEECKSAILALAPPATGMKLVPEEPTTAMLDAMADVPTRPSAGYWARVYRAMLAAVTVKP